MIKILDTTKKGFRSTFEKIVLSRRNFDDKLYYKVNRIINDVKINGDRALIKYEKKFNNNSSIYPSEKKIQNSINQLSLDVKKAIKNVYQGIYKWHKLQIRKNIIQKDRYGNKFSYIARPLDSCAVYCPGNLPSSALMNCILANLAGVKRIVLCTPAVNGKLNGAVMYAAKLCNVKEIINISGASAISALAYGTKKIKPVKLITGPGSKYVAISKKILSGKNLIAQERMYAGESEIVSWCDKSASSKEIAYSILAQSEHSSGVMSLVFSKDLKLINSIKSDLLKLIKNLPRKGIIYKSLKKYGALIYARSDKEILDLIEFTSPEHLELKIKNYKKYINKLHKKLINTGSIAAGPYSSMSLSDFGPLQHSLPTNGTAAFSGGLNVGDFVKYISINELSKKGLKSLWKSGYILANEEMLTGHAMSIKTIAKKRIK